jgi:hypothetical protein
MSLEFLFFAFIEIVTFVLIYFLMRTKEKLSASNSKYVALKKQYEQFMSVDEYKASVEQELLRIQKESQDHLESNRQEIAQLKKESEDQLLRTEQSFHKKHNVSLMKGTKHSQTWRTRRMKASIPKSIDYPL